MSRKFACAGGTLLTPLCRSGHLSRFPFHCHPFHTWRRRDSDRMPEILDGLSNSLTQFTTQMSRWRYFEFRSYAIGVDLHARTIFWRLEAYFGDWHHQDSVSELAKWMVELLKAATNVRRVEFNTLVSSLKTPKRYYPVFMGSSLRFRSAKRRTN